MNELSNQVVKTSDVIGVEVRDANRKVLGEIKEIVLNKVSGQAQYVVLSFGGFMGMGDKYFAFPWKSISYSQLDESFVLNVNENLLKQENGFDKDNWPTMAQWPETVDKYYGTNF